MPGLYEVLPHPDLREPLLVMALAGWVDAGGAARSARDTLHELYDFEVLASFDSDLLLDHRANRPMMELQDGVHQGITWPEIELLWAADDDGNHFLLLEGSEPDHLWRTFTNEVIELSQDLGVRMALGLGAYPAPVPHTRATELSSSSNDEELARRIGWMDDSVQVPAGIQGTIEFGFGLFDIPATGLWARVPHYASAMPYPAAARALLDGLHRIGGIAVSDGALLDEIQQTRHRLDELVADSPEHQELVAQLETLYDQTDRSGLAADGDPEGSLPTGDELASEIQNFLRERE